MPMKCVGEGGPLPEPVIHDVHDGISSQFQTVLVHTVYTAIPVTFSRLVLLHLRVQYGRSLRKFNVSNFKNTVSTTSVS